MFSSNSTPFKFAQNQSGAQVVLKENNKPQQKQAKKSSADPKLKLKTTETVPVNIHSLLF